MKGHPYLPRIFAAREAASEVLMELERQLESLGNDPQSHLSVLSIVSVFVDHHIDELVEKAKAPPDAKSKYRGLAEEELKKATEEGAAQESGPSQN